MRKSKEERIQQIRDRTSMLRTIVTLLLVSFCALLLLGLITQDWPIPWYFVCLVAIVSGGLVFLIPAYGKLHILRVELEEPE